MARRIVVTGLGTVNPLGNNVKDFWRAIKAGENGIVPLDRFDTTDFTSKIAGQVKDFAPGQVLETKEARRMDRFTQFAMVAAAEAMADAGLAPVRRNRSASGASWATGSGASRRWRRSSCACTRRDPRAFIPCSCR